MDPPVFIVGCGRSGTSLVQRMLALHGDVSWISILCDRLRRPELATLNAWYRRTTRSASVIHPSEAYRTWDRIAPEFSDSGRGALTEQDADESAARRLRAVAESYCRFGAGRVFINKNTRNSLRTRYLSALWPEARFVHVIRSPLDVVASLLEVPWWDSLPLWTEAGRSPREIGGSPVQQCAVAAQLWRSETELVRESRELSERPSNWLQLRYESLVQSPAAEFTRLIGWLTLTEEQATVSRAALLPNRRSVDSYRRRLHPEQVAQVWATVGGVAESLGYEHPD